jgi:serine/threonine protein phosphatase 1
MTTTPKTITYAIGDIHGMDDEFVGLLRAVLKDAGARSATPRFIFLGNVTGRGPNSVRVLDAIIKLIGQYPGSCLLRGSQEHIILEMLLGNLSEREFARWMYTGGQKTLESYGIEEISVDYEETAEFIISNYPHHFQALFNSPHLVIEGDYCFVNAGVRPGVPMSEQNADDTWSIGEEFTRHEGMFDKIVVHGSAQTWHLYPEVHDNRIAINTGAFNCGRLTALAVEDGVAARFLLTQPGQPNRVEQYVTEQFRISLAPPESKAA